MTQKLILPINKTRVTAGYRNEEYRKKFGYVHYGVDWTDQLRADTRLWGSGNGEVVAAGFDGAAFGNVVVCIYRNCELITGKVADLTVRMAHLASIRVKKGDKVTKDTVLGHYGNTGNSTGAHLHLEVDTDVKYPCYTAGIARDGEIIKRGSDRTIINPNQALYVKTSVPDSQSMLRADSTYSVASDIGYKVFDDTESVEYYKKPAGSFTSLVEALKSIGVDSSFGNRGKIAVANGIVVYTGTASQNDAMLSKLMAGKLIKA